ncbi:hypothetical protein KJ975_10315 [Myxococcota bacterium]|nr:hypothetical protein [Myxococcota bacterium]
MTGLSRRAPLPVWLTVAGVLFSCQRGVTRSEPPPPAATAPAPAKVDCARLPGACPARPWPPAQARAADFPGERNSDGTLKRLSPAPPNDPGHTVVLCYDDFGPPSLQEGLVGPEWWSWEAGGSFEPGDSFDVRIVVFSGRTEQEVQELYPTVKGISDYRRLSRDAALRYLDEKIAELGSLPPDPDEYDFGPLKRRLEATRGVIRECLPQ